MQIDSIIGQYKILRPLGKGGMGEVYLAEDTRLKRQVAIKVLPERLRSDEARLKRFRREAEAAATLNHPNIATIFALEEMDGPDGPLMFITMEYVEGSALNELIPDDGMDIDQFFSLFIPLTDALSHAHQQGRIHRDLKPANIVVTEDGTPKILDFGLARIIDPDPVRAYSDTESDLGEDEDTLTVQEQGIPSLTRAGQLVGTPQYMSPEQAEREDTDARTDIFSLGVVMYEAITGQKPFEGKTLESIIGKIMEAEPKSISEIKPITPYSLGTLIRSSLRKDREERVQNAKVLHADLRDIQNEFKMGTVLVDASTIPEPVPEPVGPEPIALWRRPAAIVGIAAAMLIVGLTSAWFLKPAPEVRLRKFQWPVEDLRENFNPLAISPDGTMVAYVADNKLWIRDLDQIDPRQIPDSQGARSLFWSPGSNQLGYFTNTELRRVAATGGSSLTLHKLTTFIGSATWRPDGTIILDKNNPQRFGRNLSAISSDGGSPAVYLEPDSTRHEKSFSAPHVLPDGQTLIFVVTNQDNSGDIVIQDGNSRRSLVHIESAEFLASPHYDNSGHILYASGTGRNWDIWALPRLTTRSSRQLVHQ